MMMATPALKFVRYPALWLALGLSTGILAASLVAVPCQFSAIVTLALLVAAFALKGRASVRALLFVAFVGLGSFLYQLEMTRNSSQDRIRILYDSGRLSSGTPVEVEGVMTAPPETSNDGAFLTVRAETITSHGEVITARGDVRFFIPNSPVEDSGGSVLELGYGSRVRITCAVEREDQYVDPGVQTTREALDRLGIDASCTVKSRMLIEHLADESVLWPLKWVFDARARLIDEFRAHLDEPTAGVMIASLLGNKYFLDKGTADLFREGGTFHILVISGLHITFIGGILLLLVRRFTRRRWVHFAVTAIILWAYTLAVGADAPVVRASVMFTIFLLGHASYRQGSLLNSLGVCAIVLLAWRPSALFDPSFQLTFISVAAIVACAYPLIEKLRAIGSWSPTPKEPFPPLGPKWLVRFCETLYWNEAAYSIAQSRNLWTARILKSPFGGRRLRYVSQKVLRYLFEGILVSAIVQVWMLPLSVWYFHRVSFAGVILNIWVGSWIAIESFAAVAGAIAGNASGLLASGFYFLSDLSNWCLLTVPRIFADNGWASFRVPAYHGWGACVYAVYFIPLAAGAFLITKWDPFETRVSRGRALTVQFLAAASVVLALLVVDHPDSAPAADGRLHLDILDVGQGDSILVTFPNGQTLLVDGGGRPDYRGSGSTEAEKSDFKPDHRTIGESVVSEVLWYKGYSSIDRILATHADADHIQGLVDVAKNFRVESAFFGRTPAADPEFAELSDVLRKRAVPARVVGRGDVFTIGGATVEVLYPLAEVDADLPSDNDHSVVLRITFGARAFLLTGDIERAAEASLISNGGTLAADIVKVPHHGSRTSSTAEFVAATGAKFAVISVGRHSPFGHPHPDVVERWQASGTEVLATGENGMISVATDGTDLSVTRYIPE